MGRDSRSGRDRAPDNRTGTARRFDSRWCRLRRERDQVPGDGDPATNRVGLVSALAPASSGDAVHRAISQSRKYRLVVVAASPGAKDCASCAGSSSCAVPANW